jgi:hypothetical protein
MGAPEEGHVSNWIVDFHSCFSPSLAVLHCCNWKYVSMVLDSAFHCQYAGSGPSPSLAVLHCCNWKYVSTVVDSAFHYQYAGSDLLGLTLVLVIRLMQCNAIMIPARCNRWWSGISQFLSYNSFVLFPPFLHASIPELIQSNTILLGKLKVSHLVTKLSIFLLWRIDPFLGTGSVNRPAAYEHVIIEGCPLLGNGAVNPPVLLEVVFCMGSAPRLYNEVRIVQWRQCSAVQFGWRSSVVRRCQCPVW